MILFYSFFMFLFLPGIHAEEPQTVPPQGTPPFDPRPLMDKVSERIKTDKFRFAVLGDTKHATSFPALATYLDDVVKPDFVLTTGDMVRSGGGSVGPGYWQKLAEDSGESMRKRPWWPSLGNHEIAGDPIINPENDAEIMSMNRSTGLKNFKNFYNLEREYYSFTFRNSVFIALPFSMPEGESETWLRSELKKAAAEGRHIFVFNHSPFYTIGGKSNTEIPNEPTTITRLFDEFHVCAVFSGHDHGYYRTIRNGVPYIISAGAGAKIYPAKRRHEALPEDVYYFGDPDSDIILGPVKYILHNGISKQPDRITEAPEQFLAVVDVDGNDIKLSCVSTKGDKWDEMNLGQPTKQPKIDK